MKVLVIQKGVKQRCVVGEVVDEDGVFKGVERVLGQNPVAAQMETVFVRIADTKSNTKWESAVWISNALNVELRWSVNKAFIYPDKSTPITD